MTVTLTSRHATVTVEQADVIGHFGRVYPAFVVTRSTGYRAELPVCGRDDCSEGRLARCVKPAEHARTDNAANREHNRTHCHGWHEEKVELFAEQVLATYGIKPKPVSRTVGVPRGSGYVRRQMVFIAGWPDPEARAW